MMNINSHHHNLFGGHFVPWLPWQWPSF
jgi:hypothetical protein